MGATKRLGRTALVMVVGWTLVAVVFAHSALPRTPLNFGLKRGWAYAVAPEWWAFFTRDPTEAQAVAYRLRSGTWTGAMAVPNSSAANLFGFRRKGRGQGSDFDQILIRVPRDAWTACSSVHPARCLPSRGRTSNVVLGIDQPLLCGLVGIVRTRPVSWDQAKRTGAKPASEWVVVRVRCPQS